MPNKFKIKRGSVAPTNSANIDNYELVYNYTDNELWTKHNGSVVQITSNTSGTVTNVVTENGISGGPITSTGTIGLNFSTLTDMTGDISGTTEFILQNGTVESRKAASEIKLTAFDATGFSIAGAVDTSGTPIAQEYARFTDANTIEGRSAAGVRTDLGLNIGTNVQAQDTLLQDIADFDPDLVANDGKVIALNSASGILELVEQSGGADTAYLSTNQTFTGAKTFTARLTISDAGADGLHLNQDTGATSNSNRLFFTGSATSAIFQSGSALSFRSGATAGSSSGTQQMYINSSGMTMFNNINMNANAISGVSGIYGNGGTFIGYANLYQFKNTTGGILATISGSTLDIPNTGDWSYIKNATTSGGLRFGTNDGSGNYANQIEISNAGNYVKLNENTTVTGNLTVSGSITGTASNSTLLNNLGSGSFLRSDANDTASGQYNFTKVNDHAIKVGTIRGTAVGSQTGQFIQLYERVNIGGPSGWGATNTAAPANGLSTYGGADLATDTGDVTIGGNLKLTRAKGLLWDYAPDTGLGGYIAHPGGGMFRNSSGTNTGALTITLPSGGGPADMVSFWVDIFDYTSYKSQSFYIAGYVYQTAGSNEWVNETAMMLTPRENHARTVRFGHDGTNHVVYIGELTDTWSYPQVTVRNVQVGYASDVDLYNDNWGISFQASAFANVDATFSGADTLPSAGKIKMTDGSGKFVHNATSSRDKIRVWNSSAYAIGMEHSNNYGGLGDQYAMTFTMDSTTNRGFLWAKNTHTKSQGAMSVTNDGKLAVAHSMRLGYGESDTTTPGASYALDVSGHAYASSSFLGPDGSAATPAFRFHNDGNTGILRTAADTIGFSTGGSTRFTMNGSGVLYVSSAVQAGNGGIQIWDGTHGFKTVLGKDSTYTKLFNNDGTVMMYMGDSGDAQMYYQANEHRFRNLAGSAYYARIGNGYIRGEGGGSVGTPQFSFQNDPNTGMYSLGADDLGFSAGGSLKYGILNGLNRFYANVVVGPNNNNSKPYIQYKDGYDTASTPSYSWYYDNGCGIGHPAGSTLAFSTGSGERARITNSGLQVHGYIDANDIYVAHGGSDYSPGINFLGGSDTPGSNAYENGKIAYYDNSGTAYMRYIINRGAGGHQFYFGATRMLSVKSDGNIELRSDGSSQGASIQRVGGIQFTWDRDTYGTDNVHSIRSDSDNIILSSYDDVTINLDSNNNDSGSTFDIRQHASSLTGGELLFQVNQSGISYTMGASQVGNGSAAAPTLSFYNDTDLGFYRNGANNMRFSAGNAIRGTWNGDGLVLNGGSLGVNVAIPTTDGVIRAGNDVIAFYSSDERLKENVKPIENALDKVSSIRGVEFDWIVDKEIHANKGHDVGVIAQEIEKVLPEVVETRDNGYKAVKYEKIVSLLIEAVKEQQVQIDELKTKLGE